MIIEIAIGVATIVAAGGLASVLRRVRGEPAAPALPSAPVPTGPRGLRCRDVVTGPGLEVALHAMIELDEDGLVLRAFRTLELEERWLVQLDREGKRLALGAATREVPDGQIPEALPIGGRMVRIQRRGWAVARIEGDGIPPMQRVRYAILAERAGRTVVVLDPEAGARLALRLDELDVRGIDVLQGGDVPRS